MDKYKKVLNELLEFRDERDWKQFHDSKNLAAAISIEAAELNELFLWKTIKESEEVDISKIKEELADILSFSFLLAEKNGLDPFEIVSQKIKINSFQKSGIIKTSSQINKIL